MENSRIIFIIAALALVVRPVRAESIWIWTHEASGSGTANVFDGGPPVSDGGTLTNPNGATFQFSASDRTRVGTLGARAHASGHSFISTLGDELTIRLELGAEYRPSLFGGDNPGGTAEASLSSVIEFVMPTNELDWVYGLGIDQNGPFEGSTSVVFENVTQSRTLLTLTSDTFAQTTLVANIGDVLRLTTTMSGAGTMGPGSGRQYDSELGMVFTVPDAGTWTLLLLGAGAPLLIRCRRSVPLDRRG